MKEIVLVCNAHLDPVWLWRWQEGAGEALSTFRTAADFCEEFDGFVFNHNEALLYEWVEEYDPELFERIRRLADQGKWHIMGGWYLQPDCVMVSGESLIRQILYGRIYFQRKFHAVPTTAVNFDSFGHSLGLVQILKKAGYDSYIVCRPGKAGELPGNDFQWIGMDGSRIAVHHSDENYNSVKGKAAEELELWMQKHREEELGLFLWGVGDHGGGPSRRTSFRCGNFSNDGGTADSGSPFRKPIFPGSPGGNSRNGAVLSGRCQKDAILPRSGSNKSTDSWKMRSIWGRR